MDAIMRYLATFLYFTLIISAPAQLLSASQDLELTASTGTFKFPFFTVDTPVWQYNDQIPGPTIRAREGTTLTINFNNRLDEPSTIHWHGLRIDNAMDGVPGVTQEAVQPGDSFVYNLDLKEAGTFWYHPHFNNSEQLERGLKGVLIVEEQDTQPWSRELVLLLDDWLLQKNGEIYPSFNTPRDLMHDGRWGNVPTVNGKVKPEFIVNPGERVRIRLINGANARVFQPQLDDLDLTAEVVAVDGRPVSEVFPLGVFYLSPGNRIDLDVTVPADGGGKIFTLKDGFSRKKYQLATVRVADEPSVSTPDFAPPVAENFIPAELFDEVSITKTWDLNAFRGGDLGIGWGMNQKLWPDSDKVDIKLGQPQKIVFQNSSGRLHPMHIHGVFFRVLERNGKPAVEPFTRDTVLVGPKETVVIGLVPEHTGIWVTHCHILEHAEAGMMTSIGVDRWD
jgi:FtsP/CotA-like multicopper oxidase with cupredoxin domain